MKYTMLLLILVLTACTGHNEMAKQYKLELNYYENSVKFTNLKMVDEAYDSCMRTEMLRTECFTSLAQSIMARNITPAQEFCMQINPDYEMPMSRKAFELVYREVDKTLALELREKIRPSAQRKETLKRIKEECLQKAK
ncbi:hypothetical protein GF323_01540 [Candidatus Woesearchaeota archaeon]|nr:hypothetical protein [Candidatus Woesearchaeota archaeon]